MHHAGEEMIHVCVRLHHIFCASTFHTPFMHTPSLPTSFFPSFSFHLAIAPAVILTLGLVSGTQDSPAPSPPFPLSSMIPFHPSSLEIRAGPVRAGGSGRERGGRRILFSSCFVAPVRVGSGEGSSQQQFLLPELPDHSKLKNSPPTPKNIFPPGHKGK